MSAAAVEQRLVALSTRYDVIESSLRELNNSILRTAAASCSVSSSAAAAAKSKNQKAHVDPTTIAALQPCAEDTPEVAALRKYCLNTRLYSAIFKWVPSEYYQRNLQWRRDILGAATIGHLCKTIVLENTHCVNADCSVRENSRFYMIVYQYVDKFDSERVMRVIKEMNEGLGKKKFNFRLADPAKSQELTGFSHGAVAALGTKTSIPVVLSANVMKLSPPHFWMGGGHIDCKCRVDIEEFVEKVNPIVAPISVPLSAEELEQIAD